MSDKDKDGIFQGAKPEGVIDDNQDPKPAPTDQYSDLVGEGKKYATIEAAMASVAPAQEHISKLETENEQLRTDLEARKTVEETLNSIVSNKEEGDRPTPSSLNEEAVEQIVANAMSKKEANATLITNIATVETRMVKEFGEKASEKVAAKAEELGVSIDFMMGIAAKSPTAFLNQFGLNKSQGTPAPQESTVRTEGFQNQPPAEKKRSAILSGDSKAILEEWRSCAPEGSS